MECFRVLAATAGPFDAVVAALTGAEAGSGREIAQQTGEEQGQQGYGAPADTTMGLGAGEGFVCTRVLVITGTVVEQPLNAAHTCTILQCTLSRAHAPAATHPTGGQHPRANALRTATPATLLTLVPEFMQAVVYPATRDGPHRHGLMQRFELLCAQLHSFGLDSDDLCAPLSQQPVA